MGLILPVAHYNSALVNSNAGDGTVPSTSEPETGSTHQLIGGYFTMVEGQPTSNRVYANSLNLTAANQIVRSVPSTLDLNNIWTLVFWFYTTNTSTSHTLFDTSALTNSKNRIRVILRPDAASDPVQLQLYDRNGIIFKDLRWNTCPALNASGTWMQLAFSWDGANIKCYFNAIDQGTPDVATVDFISIMNDTLRIVALGSDIDGTSEGDVVVHQVIGFNKALSNDDIKISWNHGCAPYFDPQNNYDGFTGFDRVKLWYRFHDITSFGRPFIGSTNLTLTSLGATTVSSTNIIRETPKWAYIELNNPTQPATQFLQATETSLGLTDPDVYTIMICYKLIGTKGSAPADNQTIFDIYNGADNDNRIELRFAGNHGLNQYTSTGTAVSQATITVSALMGEEEFRNQIYTKVASDAVRFSEGGILHTPTNSTSAIARANETMIVSIGKNFVTAARNKAEMGVHFIAIWNSALSSAEMEQVSLYGYKLFDLRVNKGSYVSASSLIHWVKFGDPARTGETGNDFLRTVVGNLDFTTDSTGIATSNIKVDSNSGIGHTFVPTSSINLIDNTTALLGIANSWSVSSWNYIKTTPSSVLSTIFIVGAAGGANSIRLRASTTVGHQVDIRDPVAGAIKDYLYESTTPPANFTWAHYVITWDGTTLKFYKDSVLQTATTLTTDASAVMTDTARAMNFTITGGAIAGATGHSALFSSVLTADEIKEIYQAGYNKDLRYNFGAYVSKTTLQHYYKLQENYVNLPSTVDDQITDYGVGTSNTCDYSALLNASFGQSEANSP